MALNVCAYVCREQAAHQFALRAGEATVLSQAKARAHSAMGTPYWMAPEVAACQNHGGRAAHMVSFDAPVDSLSSYVSF